MDIHQTKNSAAIGLLVAAIFLILNFIVYSRPAGDWWLPLLLLLLAALLWFVVGRPRAADGETQPVAAPAVRELLPSDVVETTPAIAASTPSAAVVEAAPVVVEAAASASEPAPVVGTVVEPVVAEAEPSASEPAPAVESVVAAYSAPTVESASEAPKPKSRSKKEKVTTIAADNLQRIEGIGPKMAKALNSAGITTFMQLADADEATLRVAIEAGGLRFAPSLPTWAKQAKYLADGDEVGFQTYVDSLTSGRA